MMRLLPARFTIGMVSLLLFALMVAISSIACAHGVPFHGNNRVHHVARPESLVGGNKRHGFQTGLRLEISKPFGPESGRMASLRMPNKDEEASRLHASIEPREENENDVSSIARQGGRSFYFELDKFSAVRQEEDDPAESPTADPPGADGDPGNAPTDPAVSIGEEGLGADEGNRVNDVEDASVEGESGETISPDGVEEDSLSDSVTETSPEIAPADSPSETPGGSTAGPTTAGAGGTELVESPASEGSVAAASPSIAPIADANPISSAMPEEVDGDSELAPNASPEPSILEEAEPMETESPAAPSPTQEPPVPSAFGENCAVSTDCAGELQCVGSVCDVVGELGDGCASDNDCLNPFVCASNTCAIGTGLATEGEPCNAGEDCASPLICRDDVCMTEQTVEELSAEGQSGDACSADADCIVELVCLQDLCSEKAELGGYCLTTADCNEGVCAGGNECVDPRAQVVETSESDVSDSMSFSSSSSLNVGAIVGGVIAGLIGIVLVGTLVFMSARHRLSSSGSRTGGGDGAGNSSTLYGCSEGFGFRQGSGFSGPSGGYVSNPSHLTSGNLGANGSGIVYLSGSSDCDSSVYTPGLSEAVVPPPSLSGSTGEVLSYSQGSGEGNVLSRDSHLSPVLFSIQDRSVVQFDS